MFAAPLWLAALATLAIPLALHFWSRRPRQAIRVGSLRHVEGLAETRSWSARITEPLLLLVRLALLATVVLALAGTKLGGNGLDARISRLILVEPALLRDSALIASDPLLDSLARSRAPVRLLAPGLPRVQLDGVRPVPAGAATGPAGMLWDQLIAADRLVAPGGTMLVIARPRVVHLGGRRPALLARVTWHLPQGPAEQRWRAGRWAIGPDSILTVEGIGTAQATRYQLRTSPAPCADCPALPRLAVAVEGADSAGRRRLHLAALAVGSLLGQRVEPAASAAEADLILSTSPADSPTRGKAPVLWLRRGVSLSPALADTLLAHWPGNPLAVDIADPREVSLAQALPNQGAAERLDERNARLPLLLLGLMLFAVERWLATRPRSRVA